MGPCSPQRNMGRSRPRMGEWRATVATQRGQCNPKRRKESPRADPTESLTARLHGCRNCQLSDAGRALLTAPASRPRLSIQSLVYAADDGAANGNLAHRPGRPQPGPGCRARLRGRRPEERLRAEHGGPVGAGAVRRVGRRRGRWEPAASERGAAGAPRLPAPDDRVSCGSLVGHRWWR